jgi:formamidopyrimidine-DNA glycosylase
MPELPDVEIYKRYLEETSLHQPVARVHIGARSLLQGISPQALARRLHHRPLERTHRHGKYLFAEVDHEGWLMLHFGMTGRLRYGRSPDTTAANAEAVFFFDNGRYLAHLDPRKLGHIGWVDDPRFMVRDSALGPDALRLDFDRFRRLAEGRHGQVKCWLMNQHVMAGIGNVYSDEILFQARLRPDARVDRLSDRDLCDVFEAMQDVMETAIDVDANPAAFPRTYLLPHRHKAGCCPRCGGRLERRIFCGRGAWLCPRCQRRTR